MIQRDCIRKVCKVLSKYEKKLGKEHTAYLFTTTSSVFADMKMRLSRECWDIQIVRGDENGARMTKVKRPNDS